MAQPASSNHTFRHSSSARRAGGRSAVEGESVSLREYPSGETSEHEYFEIGLTKGQVARVSAEDFEELSKHKWRVQWNRHTKSFYAVRWSPMHLGRRSHIYMHRVIMGFPSGLAVDHRNGNTLDNRRSNLRIATNAENIRNSKKRSNNTSGYKGVGWQKRERKWRAAIRVEGSRICLGYYDNPEDAHAAYVEAAKRFHGEFWRAS